MRFVERTAPGQIGLNYMWLPTWVGMNTALIRELEQAVAAAVLQQPLDDNTLDRAHACVLETLREKMPNLPGLYDYLDGIKFVQDGQGLPA